MVCLDGGCGVSVKKKKHHHPLTLANKHKSTATIRMSALKSNKSRLSSRHLTNSASSATLKDSLRRQNFNRSTFDINNIVIPFNTSSAARLEILQYKEIITPK